MLILSILPLIIFVLFVFFGKLKILWASLISLFSTLVLVVFVWQMKFSFIEASFLKGTFLAADILLIIFGALFFLETLRKTRIIEGLCLYLEKISPDYRVQVILLAWFLESFLEGTAGFGAPSAIVAPLLIGIGLSPITAVSVALLGNSASVVFGAAGTPIRVGFSGINIVNVPLYTALINMVGFLVPVFMLWMITSKQIEKRKHFLEALPFAIFSGIAFVVPSVFFVFLGQEFPSIIGSIVGFLLVFLAIKLKIFIPKQVRVLRKEQLVVEKMNILKALTPYILLIILLIIGKIFFNNMGYTVDFGYRHTFSFFNPGIAFILATIPTIFLFRKNVKFEIRTVGESLKKAIEPFLVIAVISIMVQLMVNSSQNLSGYFSLLQIIADNFKTGLLPFISPIIGAFGSFLTGSATVSNIMFGNILENTSKAIGFNPAIILSLELVGAAAGNMIALADILPTLTVVNLKGEEREVIKRVFIPCAIYVLLAGIVGLLIA
ncbi:L-lactate permease [Patescibacteria group bacterium]|nr:L-lactate permease [Patescibacteria group bacterium]